MGSDLGACCMLWPQREHVSASNDARWLFDGELALVLGVDPRCLSKLVCVVGRTGDVVAVERALLGRLVGA